MSETSVEGHAAQGPQTPPDHVWAADGAAPIGPMTAANQMELRQQGALSDAALVLWSDQLGWVGIDAALGALG